MHKYAYTVNCRNGSVCNDLQSDQQSDLTVGTASTLSALSHKDGPNGSAPRKLFPRYVPYSFYTLPMWVLARGGFLLDQGDPEHAPQQPQAAIDHKQARPVVVSDDGRR